MICVQILSESKPASESERYRNEQLEAALEHLMSQDGEEFWTSGQWMTERGGGSDVGAATATTAVESTNEDGWVPRTSRSMILVFLILEYGC